MRTAGGDAGQSFVETALALPVIVLLAACAVELTRIGAIACLVQVAALQTARAYAVQAGARDYAGDMREPVQRAMSVAGDVLQAVRADPRQVETRIRPPEAFVHRGCTGAAVTVTYFAPTMFSFLPYPGLVRRAGGSWRLPICGTALSRIESGERFRDLKRPKAFGR